MRASRLETHRTSNNCSKRSSSCQNCYKNSQTEDLRFLKDQKVWNLWLQLYHHRILDNEPGDELRQNFISDERQFHTSTRSELNLIKSVIYIYIYRFVLCFIFYTIFYYNFGMSDWLNNFKLVLSFIKSTKIKAFLIDFIIIDKTSYEFVLENTISTPDDFSLRRKD